VRVAQPQAHETHTLDCSRDQRVVFLSALSCGSALQTPPLPYALQRVIAKCMAPSKRSTLLTPKCDTKCRLYAALPSASAAVAYLEPRTSAKFCCRCESAGRRPVGLPLLRSLPAPDQHEQTSAAATTDTRPVVGAA